MHAYARLKGSGCMLPQELRCSVIASEAILGQKQSRSSYTGRGVLHPIFGCPCVHFLSQQTSDFLEISTESKVGRTTGGMTSLEEQL